MRVEGVGRAEDVLTDGVEGFVVPIRDSAAIREKILYLYENPSIRDAMAQAALRRATSLLSTRTHGVRAYEAYHSAYKSRNGPR